MRKKHLLMATIALLLMLQPALNLARASATGEQTTTTISITPSHVETLGLGDWFSINVSAENCVSIYAVQIDIHYDPTVLELVDIQPGPLFVFPEIISNASNVYDEMQNLTYNGPTYGQIYYVATRLGGDSGITGDAPLFTVDFRVISTGSTQINLIEYGGDGSTIGTYFMTWHVDNNSRGYYPTTDVVPKLYNATYGENTAPTTPASNTDTQGQVQSAQLLPYLLPFTALFLIVIGRKVTRKPTNP